MPDDKATILIQLDVDAQPSVFDAVVAVDAKVDHLFRHGDVTPENVQDLVYGALFTRGPADLHRTALFVGGSDVAKAEAVLAKIRSTFFGPFRVSVLFDANGSNTTAAAAALAALSSVGGSLQGVPAAVLAATGPVGQRVARLLGRLGATVAVGSRDAARSGKLAERLHATTGATYQGFSNADASDLERTLAKTALVVSAGPEGARLISAAQWKGRDGLRVVVDLNAVPPAGIEGVEANDKNVDRGGIRAWGALGVGGLKMKIHKRAIQDLFRSNDKILDAEEVLELGRDLV
ncbi:NAD(P)-dependent methylenetetrahydromethanopterin dehydrogenase [Paludisphaera mucosa]|uniref:Methylenetetrahydromethanopterin dehydrogenase n=1 Tax=Paludisphaera mucosa TaxID=3030827 RepID=A0ABT6F8N6_9BACT|nr:NAD(P)-dependent methylenetetrahydromethanopterin dehydrogenase [Paludisphaera mucosa]MDG3003920.1 methylenetetrahydromethanopterin dehydrogenase [Paludisphaera mucosa]